jgi:D-lactate dehydrogenase (cytochrome)
MPSVVRSAGNVQPALADLQVLLGPRVTTSQTQREHHSHGESYHTPHLPDVVCFPKETREVCEIMRISARYRVPVIPFGAGTSVEGHVNAIHGGIAIDMREMNKVLRVSVEDCDATVEAGVTRLQLVKALEDTGLTFFVDPGADATIGGMASTRASGTTAVRYGTMRENVLGLTVVLADGRVIQTGGRARKSSAGYDLTHLFVGSEGTLGVLTEVILRLHPLPEAVAAAVCSFEAVRGAVETSRPLGWPAPNFWMTNRSTRSTAIRKLVCRYGRRCSLSFTASASGKWKNARNWCSLSPRVTEDTASSGGPTAKRGKNFGAPVIAPISHLVLCGRARRC